MPYILEGVSINRGQWFSQEVVGKALPASFVYKIDYQLSMAMNQTIKPNCRPYLMKHKRISFEAIPRHVNNTQLHQIKTKLWNTLADKCVWCWDQRGGTEEVHNALIFLRPFNGGLRELATMWNLKLDRQMQTWIATFYIQPVIKNASTFPFTVGKNSPYPKSPSVNKVHLFQN